MVLRALDMQGIAASSGSACTSASMTPSHVLLAMGLAPGLAHGALRMTLGIDTTAEQIARVMEVLPAAVERARALTAAAL